MPRGTRQRSGPSRRRLTRSYWTGWPRFGVLGVRGPTVKGILADNNVEGHVNRLLLLLHDDDWREFWASLGLTVESFASLDLPEDTPDAALWQTSQQRELVL